MKTMWKKAIRIIWAGGLSAICLAGCGKDAAGSQGIPTQEIRQNNVADGAGANNNEEDDRTQTDNSASDDGASGSMGDGAFLYGANLQGDVVEFSDDTDKESVKKQSSVCVFGSCQDTYQWTADKILILRWQ